MNFLGALLAGVLLGLAEIACASRLPAAPDLTAVALALLLSGDSSRSTGARCTGLLLGASACALEPVGAFLLGGGIAALLLTSLRTIVFGESLATKAAFGLTAALALALGRTLCAWAGLTPALAWEPSSFTTPLLTAAVVPILALASSGLRRMARWSADRLGALRGSDGGAPE